MRFALDSWDPSYDSPVDASLLDAAAPIDPTVECGTAAASWAPRRPAHGPANEVVFVDGVRRVEARTWLESAGADSSLSVAGQFASWAAGAVCCVSGEVAVIDPVRVEHVIVAPAPGADREVVTAVGSFRPVLAQSGEGPALWLAVQDDMARGERVVSDLVRRDRPGALLVVDGPLRGRDHLERTVGFVKTHHVDYLRSTPDPTITARLAPGERTPLFLIGGAHPRLTWYVRLAPSAAPIPMASCVRCEIASNTSIADAVALADVVTATLPRFASDPVKDPRAPQNLTPIGGLERLLRHRLGDRALVLRALRAAAGRSLAGAVSR